MPALLLGALLAQTVVPPGPDAAEIQRIRKALTEPPPVLTLPAPPVDVDTRVFRVQIRAWKFTFPVWHDDSVVPPYVRPTAPPVHFEFLQQVTPEFFRASVLYPGYPMTPYGGLGLAVPVVPIVEALNKRIKAVKKRADEKAARDEVREALARLEACRANPAGPDC